MLERRGAPSLVVSRHLRTGVVRFRPSCRSLLRKSRDNLDPMDSGDGEDANKAARKREGKGFIVKFRGRTYRLGGSEVVVDTARGLTDGLSRSLSATLRALDSSATLLNNVTVNIVDGLSDCQKKIGEAWPTRSPAKDNLGTSPHTRTVAHLEVSAEIPASTGNHPSAEGTDAEKDSDEASELESLQTRLTQAHREIDELQNRLNQAYHTVENHRNRADALNSEIVYLRSHVSGASLESSDYLARVKLLEKDINRLQSEISVSSSSSSSSPQQLESNRSLRDTAESRDLARITSPEDLGVFHGVDGKQKEEEQPSKRKYEKYDPLREALHKFSEALSSHHPRHHAIAKELLPESPEDQVLGSVAAESPLEPTETPETSPALVLNVTGDSHSVDSSDFPHPDSPTGGASDFNALEPSVQDMESRESLESQEYLESRQPQEIQESLESQQLKKIQEPQESRQSPVEARISLETREQDMGESVAAGVESECLEGSRDPNETQVAAEENISVSKQPEFDFLFMKNLLWQAIPALALHAVVVAAHATVELEPELFGAKPIPSRGKEVDEKSEGWNHHLERENPKERPPPKELATSAARERSTSQRQPVTSPHKRMVMQAAKVNAGAHHGGKQRRMAKEQQTPKRNSGNLEYHASSVAVPSSSSSSSAVENSSRLRSEKDRARAGIPPQRKHGTKRMLGRDLRNTMLAATGDGLRYGASLSGKQEKSMRIIQGARRSVEQREARKKAQRKKGLLFTLASSLLPPRLRRKKPSREVIAWEYEGENLDDALMREAFDTWRKRQQISGEQAMAAKKQTLKKVQEEERVPSSSELKVLVASAKKR